jgi:cobalt-zinc-cadmium efflux system outer membrane protein
MLPCCAVTVDSSDALDRLSREAAAATGEEVPPQGHSQQVRDELLRSMLEDGLTPTEAVRFGLANNPGFRASVHGVELAVAQRVQAGLLSNPSLQGTVRFPASGGESALEFGLLGVLKDLWQREAREAAAQSALELRILEVAQEAAQLATEIRAAYIEVLAASASLAIESEAQELAMRLAQQVEAAAAAHAVLATDLDLANQRLIEVEVAAGEAGLAVVVAGRRLLTLLGLPHEPARFALSGALPPPEVPSLDTTWLQTWALERRFDVRAARARIDQAAADLGLQEALVWRSVDVGVAAEREDEWSVGPSFSLELPLFDRNEAGIAAATARLSALDRLLVAARVAVIQDVHLAVEALRVRQDLLERLRDATGTAADAMLQRAERAYTLRQTTVFPVLQLQRSLLDARRARVAQQAALGRALAEVERATGTPWAELLALSARTHDPNLSPPDAPTPSTPAHPHGSPTP